MAIIVAAIPALINSGLAFASADRNRRHVNKQISLAKQATYASNQSLTSLIGLLAISGIVIGVFYFAYKES